MSYSARNGGVRAFPAYPSVSLDHAPLPYDGDDLANLCYVSTLQSASSTAVTA